MQVRAATKIFEFVRLPRKSQMLGDYMICTEMSGNYVASISKNTQDHPSIPLEKIIGMIFRVVAAVTILKQQNVDLPLDPFWGRTEKT
jgi:hypothetical protein